MASLTLASSGGMVAASCDILGAANDCARCLDGYGPEFPDCRPPCLAGLSDENGVVQFVSRDRGGTAALECNAGFMVSGGDGIWTCDDALVSGGKAQGSGRCVEATCEEDPPWVRHAASNSCTSKVKMCEATCEDGYTAMGAFKCAYGAWISQPTCAPTAPGWTILPKHFIAGRGMVNVFDVQEFVPSPTDRKFRAAIEEALIASLMLAVPEAVAKEARVLGMGELPIPRGSEGERLEISFRILVEGEVAKEAVEGDTYQVRTKMGRWFVEQLEVSSASQLRVLGAHFWYLETVEEVSLEPPPEPGWCEADGVEFLEPILGEESCNRRSTITLLIVFACAVPLVCCLCCYTVRRMCCSGGSAQVQAKPQIPAAAPKSLDSWLNQAERTNQIVSQRQEVLGKEEEESP